MKNHLRHISTALALFAAFSTQPPTARAQGTAITYQGRLYDGTNLANGNYDMRFHVYSAPTGGSILGGPITNAPVVVSNGLFVVTLDFGAGVFTGSSNWLQIGVRSNGVAVAYTSLSPRQQLTPSPYTIFAEGANATGLTGTIPTVDLNGANGSGLTGVALLGIGNTFTGNQTIDGMLDISDGGGTGTYTDLNIGPGGYNSGEEHSVNFNDGSGHIGSLIAGYDGSSCYLSLGNLWHDYVHPVGTKALTVFGNGNVVIDPQNLNAGLLNNGNTNSSGLTFGSGSGEGIASDRVSGVNQYGLDFYTSFAHRMSILQNGKVGIGLTNPVSKLEINGDLRLDGNNLYLESSTAGSYASDELVWGNGGLAGSIASSANGPFLAGYLGGSVGALNPNVVALSWDAVGNASVNNNLSVGSLTVRGDYLVVNGGTPVYAYLGDDGAGNDVQIGSQKSGITAVACYNTADGAYMHLYCSSITIEGGSDLAEPFKITAGKDEVPQGAVVVIDEENPGHLKMSDEPYDTRVAGVVSGANGVNPGIQMQQQGVLEGGKNVALTGRVYVQADASNGAIRPGDMLTTSATPGCAMKVSDHARAAGAILGKAMTGLSEGKGMVLVLVTLQ
jgi:hypothetical protein